MSANTKDWLRKAKDLGGVLAPFILAGSTVADLIDITDKYIAYIKPIVIISAIITFIYAIYYIVNGKKIYEKNKKIKEQQEDIIVLQKYTVYEIVYNCYPRQLVILQVHIFVIHLHLQHFYNLILLLYLTYPKILYYQNKILAKIQYYPIFY